MMPSIRSGDLAFASACAFMGGVLFAYEGWVMMFTGTIILAITTFAAGGRRMLAGTIIVITALAGGYYYCGIKKAWQDAHTHLPSGKDQEFFGLVSDEPHPVSGYLMVPIALQKPYAGIIDVFASPQRDIHYGELLWIDGTISPPKEGSDELPAMFRPRIELVIAGQGIWWKEEFVRFRAAIAKRFARSLPPDDAALLAAIVLGPPVAVSEALKVQMDVSGTSYIVGMYGYKLIMITEVARQVFAGRVPRWVLAALTAGVILIFAALSGGSVSAIRAAAMALIALIAHLSGRSFSPRNALTFTALAITVTDVSALTDAGFQLSFLSYLGIFYLRGPINNLFHWRDSGVLAWKEHAMLSLTTNLAILPVAMNTFGDFSLTAFLSNIFIMIPWALVLTGGALLALISGAGMLIAFPLAKLMMMFLAYEFSIIGIFSRFTIPFPSVFGSLFLIAFYYGMLIIFICYYGSPPQKGY